MKNQVYAKKKYGQNFLTDKNIINKIIALADVKDKNIIEIGPGRGALTKEMVKEAKSLTCYEIDGDMVEILTNEIKSDNFHLIHKDFLEVDLSNMQFSSVIANIPYYITTDILFKLFENANKIDRAVLMVQKEVAQRLVASKNSPDYSKLTLSTNYISTPKLEFIVKSGSFSPAPKVDSAIISLTFNKDFDKKDEMFEFFKLCFLARRKKLSFSLKTKYSNQTIEKAYKELNLSDNIRIQQLSLEEVIKLKEALD
ncbi:16S rRNA (adenine(1518)-N(6)/adenine(1519)-N(6))-dimethyltransferase RsmA [Mycoplasma sp. Ms02]|uniref:16S rRNA (adenine(1518)-N(6)/adenine(1519)-N(6))- dimethyltransferase RsmA n=1 Tax=Mycoplasma sp. Ms02 TaxID=353851 RepID=UPI001C896DAD|nr:16S rRNA (adenine(1518)-N(6)/adenine(1519)-N(6))-dimethyltransferase RsmA [Mycoplasma sp. Ms02]QZE12056.1 16S rRNA (adenine(1518)-N(6)/adenine(1519)-N(6))-dimethyltransferase RsmA [Mycoplasma sp. Ms02]